MKKVYANSNLCTGCELCVAACSVSRHGMNSRTLSGIRIKRDLFQRFEVQFVCRHCEDPLCVTACISGAMRKDPDSGLVTSDPELCVGCHSCVLGCPFDSVFVIRCMERDGKLRVEKCDGCPDREMAACVSVCPTEALVYDSDDPPVRPEG